MSRFPSFVISLALLFMSCSKPGAYSISLIFPDDTSRDMTKSMKLTLVRPSQEASCGKLVSLDAMVGSDGYDIEDEVSFSIPMGDDEQFLEVASGGRVLMYAEGSTSDGVLIVNGCTEIEAELGGVQEVSLELVWIHEPCIDDRDCDDGNQCTTDSCRDGFCLASPAPSGTPCDDGNFCTIADNCDGEGTCGGQTRDCSELDDQCIQGVCDEQTDACIGVAANEGQPCDDSLFCTTAEVCHDGVCGAGQPTDCDDAIDCTIDSCDEQSGSCSHQPSDSACDDGIPCTDDVCDPLQGCIHASSSGGCPFLNIGPAPGTCPHLQPDGTYTSDCDFSGTDGLSDAVDSLSGGGAAFYLYDDSGAPFVYEACSLDIPGSSLVSAGDGVDRDNVLLACRDDSTGHNGILQLVGDHVHVQNVTFINLRESNAAISTWPALNHQQGATGGHLIENVIGMALQPELVGVNGIEVPLRVGSNTTVRNCLFWGFYDHHFFLAGLSNVRLVGNTFVYLQTAGEPMEVEDSSGIVFANNLVLSLTNTRDLLATASSETTGLVISGNVLEGYADLVSGLDGSDATNLVDGNYLEQAQVRSPLAPLFLADATQLVDGTVPGEGYSLDGVSLDGSINQLPGAYQHRSIHTGPRRMIIRVGDGNCGSYGCDFTPEDENELQRAVFSSWPSGTIEIYPFGDYAGDAIIPWGLQIKGMGQQAYEVVLKSREEDGLWRQAGMWERHASIFTVLHHMELPVSIQNMSFVVDSDSQSDDRALMIEGSGQSAPLDWHTLRHLRILSSVGSSPGLKQALLLGDHVMLDDSIIHGAFSSCIRFGPRSSETKETKPSSGAVINVTCRLDGAGEHEPESALDIASVTDTYFINLAIEMETPGAFLRAQRRSVGDTGTTALDTPISYTLNSVTVKGQNIHSDGFDPSDGDYNTTSLVYLNASAPFFVSDIDSHLVDGCVALDGGVDPSIVNENLEAGISLNGVDRKTVTSIDQGCYEQ